MIYNHALPLAGEKTVSGCPGHFFINAGTYYGDMGMKRIDLTGKSFGRWTVLGESTKRESENVYWLCQCVCGVKRDVRAGHLTCGASQSC
jgi:hypothetical protein